MMKSKMTLAAETQAPRTGAPRGRPRKSSAGAIGIQSVDIALDILAKLVDHRASVGLVELSRLTDIPPSKLHRYLVSFTRHGILRQSELSGQYDFGPVARALGIAAFNRYPGLSTVHEAVSKISEQTGCAVALYLWTDLGPTLVRMQMGAHPLPVVLREGAALPLAGSATGRSFLAYLPEALTRDLLQRERALAAEEGGDKWTDAQLKLELKRIRSKAIYWTTAAIVPATLAVVPVFGASGTLHCMLIVVADRGQAGDAQKVVIEKTLLEWTEVLAQELA